MQTTTADFWLDPSCPWSVMTASWLAEVQRERGIDVCWHAMSLAALSDGNEIPEEWAQFTADSWGPVRVVASADEGFEPGRVRDLVLALGRRLRAEGRRDMDEVVRLSHKRAVAFGGSARPLDGEVAARLWDADLTLASIPGFFEVNRTPDEGLQYT